MKFRFDRETRGDSVMAAIEGSFLSADGGVCSREQRCGNQPVGSRRGAMKWWAVKAPEKRLSEVLFVEVAGVFDGVVRRLLVLPALGRDFLALF